MNKRPGFCALMLEFLLSIEAVGRSESRQLGTKALRDVCFYAHLITFVRKYKGIWGIVDFPRVEITPWRGSIDSLATCSVWIYMFSLYELVYTTSLLQKTVAGKSTCKANTSLTQAGQHCARVLTAPDGRVRSIKHSDCTVSNRLQDAVLRFLTQSFNHVHKHYKT